VFTLSRQLLACALTLLVSAGNAALCAGWAPMPSDRMACCLEGADCPMHPQDAHHAGGAHPTTQTQADSCCAASERDRSNRSDVTVVAPISSAVLGPGVVVPAITPALVLRDGWRTLAPIPLAPFPKHILHAVFLL
jgi:hypothetical protein